MKSARGYGRARVAQLNPHSRNNNQSPPATNTLAGQKCEIDALTEKIKQATLNGRYGTPEKSADKSSDSGKGSPETSSRESSGHEKLTLEQLAKEMLKYTVTYGMCRKYKNSSFLP